MLCGLGAAVALGRPASAGAQISPGPLARAHEQLEGSLQCESCHGGGGPKGGKEAMIAQCLGCHNQPALGGSGGFMVPNPQDPAEHQRPPENPMFDLIPHRKGATNPVPSFITQFGPIREVRFVKTADGRPDGGVHQLFTILGRPDIFPIGQANTCTVDALPYTDFEAQLRKNNLRFRIPLQLFGLGVLDGIQDREILGRHDESAALRASQSVPIAQ